ncbi:MAG: invasion associated locus B family protein [Microvirga sp.]|nr:invasion associated locus B family protein [Microvirga sp.]
MMLSLFIRRNAPRLALATALAAASATGALSQAGQPATQLGNFNDWGAFTSTEGGNKVCFILSQPQQRTPAELRRDPGYLFVTFRPAEGVTNEVALVMGFPTQEGQDARAVVGDASYALVTSGSNVWVRDPADETRLVESFIRGSRAEFRVTSGRGNATTDVYSLSGFTAALRRAQQECS